MLISRDTQTHRWLRRHIRAAQRRVFPPSTSTYYPDSNLSAEQYWDILLFGNKVQCPLFRPSLFRPFFVQFAEELRALIARERKELRSGKRALNKHVRSWAEE